MKNLPVLLVLLPVLVSCTSRTESTGPQSDAPTAYDTAADDWASYFGDPGGTHYSRLSQITRENVGSLREAWRYVTPDPGAVQTTPLVIDGTMYVTSPLQKVIALDAATGREKWIFDSGIGVGAAVRSLAWWSEGEEKRLFTSVSHYIYAIDPATGTAIPGFGDGGRIDLRENLRGAPEDNTYHATSPGVVYKDLYILGGRVSETTPSSPGDQRAYDVRTGELRWTFRTVPMAGEPGAETWPEGARDTQGGANAWAGTIVDTERGIVYIATGSPSDDFYGGDRLGDNLYGNCIVALNAETGEKLWHFQAVRHDLWDADFAAPPVLLTVTRDGKRVDAVAASNKLGFVYIFDRVTGEPLFPIVETPVPASTVPGEVAAVTQPVPVLPAPTSRQTISRDEVTDRTPEMRTWALAEYDHLLGTQQAFTPLSLDRPTMVAPGWKGGLEYGGITSDPDKGIIYLNVNNWISVGTLADTAAYQQTGEGERTYRGQCMGCHGAELEGTPPAFPSLVDAGSRLSTEEMTEVIRNGRGYMPGFPLLQDTTVTNLISFITSGSDSVAPARMRNRSSNAKYVFTGYNYFEDPEGYQAGPLPWGTLHAIDMNTGQYLWTVPFGEYEELAEQGLSGTGAENHGGSVLTASGILFSGGTEKDRKFYAYDSANGEILWEGLLPGYDRATPATYAVDGRQFVVIAASPQRNSREQTAATYVVFALP